MKLEPSTLSKSLELFAAQRCPIPFWGPPSHFWALPSRFCCVPPHFLGCPMPFLGCPISIFGVPIRFLGCPIRLLGCPILILGSPIPFLGSLKTGEAKPCSPPSSDFWSFQQWQFSISQPRAQAERTKGTQLQLLESFLATHQCFGKEMPQPSGFSVDFKSCVCCEAE